MHDGIKTSKILELTNIDLQKSQFTSYGSQQNPILENAKTSILLLNKVDLSWDDLFLIFQLVWHTSVEYFQIQHVTFGGLSAHNSFDYSNTVMIAIKLEHVHFRIFNIPQESRLLAFYQMDVENLTISDAQMPSHAVPYVSYKIPIFKFC